MSRIKHSHNLNRLLNPSNNLINPELLTYITRVQNERDKALNNNNKRNYINIEQVLDKKYAGLNSVMNENINFDKVKRTQAKKGLLYLLNNLSGGTFCPEINIYFEEMKELKLSEMRNNYKQMLNKSNSEKSLNFERTNNSAGNEKIKKTDNENKEKGKEDNILQNLNINNNIKNESHFQSFKKRKNSFDMEKKEFNGFKEYKDDYNQHDLENLYPSNELNDDVWKFNLNKEKKAKIKILNSSKKKNKSKKRKKAPIIQNFDLAKENDKHASSFEEND